MKRTTLDLLLCPTCQGRLELETLTSVGTIENGTLACHACQADYPIRRGIPHFIKQEDITGLNKPFARMYDWFSWIYSAFSKIGLFFLGTTESHARHDVLDLLEPNGGKVLEVSIGPGLNLPFLLNSSSVGEVYGLDISIGQLNRCNALIRRKDWSVELFLGNGEELPFTDDSFDSVFHIGGINFFSNKKKAIDEMIRVAKPSTKIIICDENENDAEWYEKFLPGFKSTFNGRREPVTAPVDLVPGSMLDLKLGNTWNDFMYCLEFRKPHKTD
jgi:ubiquinone/menaquinone biosynthesis C-methylase UbiE